MSGELHGPTRRYLVDEEARDVSRITGLEWEYQKVHSKGIARPFIDLTKLDWWDQFRVAWALVGGYTVISHFGKHTE